MSMHAEVTTMIEEVHDTLNMAAREGYLSNRGAQARDLCAQALRQVEANNGRWDNQTLDKIRTASRALEDSVKARPVGDAAERHADTACRLAVWRMDSYLKVVAAHRREAIEAAVKRTAADNSHAKESWSRRTEALARLRGSSNPKKGIGF